MRAAYATCLLPDATENLCRMLGEAKDIAPFAECLYNGAPFTAPTVAGAVLRRFERVQGMVLDYRERSVAASIQ